MGGGTSGCGLPGGSSSGGSVGFPGVGGGISGGSIGWPTVLTGIGIGVRTMWLNVQPVNRCQQRMKKCLIFIISISFAATLAMNCGAQERDPSQMSREEWQAHVEASRQRIELMRRQHQSFVPKEPSQNEIAEAASKRALQGDSLKPGDIVSTTDGLFQFRGAAEKQPTSDDFVRLP
jgi:hypothetical protein